MHREHIIPNDSAIRRRMCLDKRKYGSEKSAKKVAGLLRDKQAETAEDVRAYLCPAGTHYHVGHQALKAEVQVEIEQQVVEEALGPPPETIDITDATMDELRALAQQARQQYEN